MVLFWSTLACMYLVLAIVSLHTAKKSKAKINSWPGDAYRLLSKYVISVAWISFVGFLLAAIAAAYTAGILDKILELIK